MFEELKKQQRGGGMPPKRRGLFGGLTVADPKRRIYIMVALLVVLLAGMLHLRRLANAPQEPPGKGQAPSTELPGEPVFLGMPELDHEIAARVRDNDLRSRRLWEHEAIPYLLLEARHTPSVHDHNRNLLPLTPESATEIRKDGAPWRFHFVRFRGRLEYIEEIDYDEAFADEKIGRVTRGRVVVAEGEPAVRVHFVMPVFPGWQDPNEIGASWRRIEDGWVRGRGIFVKNYRDRREGAETPSLLVVVTSLQRDYERRAVESLESDIDFGIIDDDPSIAADPRGREVLAKLYPRPFFRLIAYADARAGKAGAELRASENLEKLSFENKARYEEVLGQPHRFRARYFTGYGAIAVEPDLIPVEETDPNDAGVEEWMNGWIFTDNQLLMQFAAPARLAGEWPVRTRIRYEGYFYKTKAYPARDGTQRMAPLLVLTVLERVPPPEPRYGFQIVLAAGFLLGIALLIFIIVREDKTKADYRRLRSRRAPLA